MPHMNMHAHTHVQNTHATHTNWADVVEMRFACTQSSNTLTAKTNSFTNSCHIVLIHIWIKGHIIHKNETSLTMNTHTHTHTHFNTHAWHRTQKNVLRCVCYFLWVIIFQWVPEMSHRMFHKPNSTDSLETPEWLPNTLFIFCPHLGKQTTFALLLFTEWINSL